MRKLSLVDVLVFACLCLYSCNEKRETWSPAESPEQVNGTWEGGDTVLLPKSIYTLSRNTSAYVTIAISSDAEKNEVVFATKYDFNKWLSDAIKSDRFEGKKKQELWDELSASFKDNADVLLDNYSITMRYIIDLYTYQQEWQPAINADGKKIRVLSNLSNILGVGAGTFFTLKKTDTAKLLAAYKTPIKSEFVTTETTETDGEVYIQSSTFAEPAEPEAKD
ncbi:MAG: hypothetical protein Ta2B_08510 [Termitinemataceae bacterium]|nr:MAG: hypothetical protein Ta2B_08510 [Termitinemataceae bacterium]